MPKLTAGQAYNQELQILFNTLNIYIFVYLFIQLSDKGSELPLI